MPKNRKRHNMETLTYTLSGIDRLLTPFFDRPEVFMEVNGHSISIDPINIIEDNSTIYHIDNYCDFSDPSDRVDMYLKQEKERFDSLTFYV